MAMDSSANKNVGNLSTPEADLDVEYTVSMTGLPVLYAANSDTSVSAFLTTALNLLDQPHPPSVLSISYGSDEFFVGTPLAMSICNAFMALGARGVSILTASGDGGVSGIQYDPGVGGTMLSQDNHEIAANLSSGGFSSIFTQPKYQQANTNRAFPDIAAIAEGLALVDDNGLVGGDGTSFATPIVASVIAIINAHRMKSNKPTLGFLNPALYANKNMFFDIVEEGWDPVTGLGTPNFVEMLKVLG
ncbi:hypothetical protein Clacol_010252 [Clathrus columnatus]|uniref:Peptidase S53 domain-containing protein n=1 Tax=Clathrus columnatus TaxID=1419009 RepID=A0AAV5ATK9_9AGAM|nr:hypothetical protein Clacol_010252 [Clathrus columnatus]